MGPARLSLPGDTLAYWPPMYLASGIPSPEAMTTWTLNTVFDVLGTVAKPPGGGYHPPHPIHAPHPPEGESASWLGILAVLLFIPALLALSAVWGWLKG
jgi:hypothetical protein